MELSVFEILEEALGPRRSSDLLGESFGVFERVIYLLSVGGRLGRKNLDWATRN